MTGHTATRDLFRYLATKQSQYITLIRAISDRLVRVARHVGQLRKQAADDASKARDLRHVDTPVAPTRDDASRSDRATFVSLPPCAKDSASILRQLQLRFFWSSLKLVPISDYNSESGTTWLEFFMLFCLHGGLTHPMQEEGASHLKPRFSLLFKSFISGSKALFSFAAADSKPLFKPLTNRARPLKMYGITSFMPMLASRVAISGEVSERLHAAICACQGRITTHKLPKRLRAGVFKLPKFIPWAKVPHTSILPAAAIRMFKAASNGEDGGACRGGSAINSSYSITTTLTLSCPNCHHSQEAAGHWLYKASSPCQLRCKACSKHASARKWSCPCRVPWITCELHRSQGFGCRGKATRCRIKRPVDTQTYTHEPPRKRRRRLQPGSALANVVTFMRSSDSDSAVEGRFVNQTMQIPSSSCDPKRRPNDYTRELIVVSSTDGPICKGQKRPLEGGGGDVRTSRSPYGNFNSYSNDVSQEQQLLNPKRAHSSGSHCSIVKPKATCNRRCPEVWTINEYCATCHG